MSKSDEIYQEIMAQMPKRVETALSKLNEILDKDVKKENFEDAAKARDAKTHLEQYLREELTYEQIKEDLSFVEGKITDLINAAFKKAKNKKKGKGKK